MTHQKINIAIVGGGVGGLALALHLHERGVVCHVFEAVAEVRELGVGITLLPHAMRELAALGIQPELEAAGIENYESAFFNRHGQFIYSELRGRHAGYALPEVGIHRGKLHKILFDTAVKRLGADHVHTGYRFKSIAQNEDTATLTLMEGVTQNDWNQAGKVEDVLKLFADWKFDWLDVTQLIANAESLLEYPMVDKDPIDQWTFGRVTFLGDAAHPMYPRGSNGSAQALIDARTLADELAKFTDDQDPLPALLRYENVRRPLANKVVQTNRTTPPDFINIKVDELTQGKPFRHIDDVISQEELRKISDDYKKIAGFSLEALKSS